MGRETGEDREGAEVIPLEGCAEAPAPGLREGKIKETPEEQVARLEEMMSDESYEDFINRFGEEAFEAGDDSRARVARSRFGVVDGGKQG